MEQTHRTLYISRLLSEFREGQLHEQEFFVADEIELRPERF